MTRQEADAWGQLMGIADEMVEEQLVREEKLRLDVLAALSDEILDSTERERSV